ncbi:DUF5986 family protein [Lachnospiraceae bacterium 29-84]
MTFKKKKCKTIDKLIRRNAYGKDIGNFSFCLLKIDRAIVEALRTALEVAMPEIVSDNNLRERNGYGQFRWNVIIAQLREQCQYLGWLDCETCTRGAWKTPVLFYTVSRNIITFMTEDTFRTVQRRKDKGKHYLCGGAGFNQGVKAQYDQLKLDLPGISEDMVVLFVLLRSWSFLKRKRTGQNISVCHLMHRK